MQVQVQLEFSSIDELVSYLEGVLKKQSENSLLVNWGYWKTCLVVATTSYSWGEVIYTLYSRDGLVLKVRFHESGEVYWSIRSLHECSCECSGGL